METKDKLNKNNNNIEKTIFNETVKKKIEKYSPINTSMVLPESEAKLKPDDSGLLITSSNETSLVNIMKGMTPPLIQNDQIQKKRKKKGKKKIRNQKIKKIKIKTIKTTVKIEVEMKVKKKLL